ncbi:MAG: type II secretion system F family protein [Planctomycetota bacterium]|jgi:type IV pilus assembly protein PilC
MAAYRYEALGVGGQPVKGELDAVDERAAAAALRQRALFVLKLSATEAAAPTAQSRRIRRKSISAQDLAFFFREMALMTRSGVTLLQALQVCERQSPNPALSAVSGRLIDRIRAGRSFSQAMEKEERCFSRLMVRLVESAEATGELDPVLDRLADVIERRSHLRRSLLTSLAYPAIVFCASITVAVFLVLGVVPKFAGFFARRAVGMPWTTRTLLDISAWMQAYGIYLLAIVVIIAGAGTYSYLTKRGRLTADRAALSIPVIGQILKVAAFSQIAWTLGALLRSGVSLLESIRITAAATGNRALGLHLGTTTTRILEGGTLSRGLEHSLVPPIVPSLLAAGERSGAMTEVLAELSQFYQRDLEQRIRRMSNLVEPALILVVGGMVAFVYLAFFQAVLQLAQR